MKYLALYRKYRPTHFSELAGQEKVVKVLKNAIINNKISHAYLFSGPRGTGKTTIAKLIAKLVNCENPTNGEPCDKCDNCVEINNKFGEDIIEIDAASNNGVDEIRELRDKINLVPSKCKFKVYIIDEVHMLTIGAFNALLKTLEEPPAHVIFILATTEPYKVPITVASRCQKFQFNKISVEDIIKRLNHICEQEKIDIEEDALYEIARMSDGALRDALTILDQLNAYKDEKITVSDVHEVIGSVSYLNLSNLVLNIIKGNSKEIINFIEDLDKSGKNINIFIEEMMFFIRDIILYKKILDEIENIPKEKLKKIKELSKSVSNDKLFEIIEKLNKLSNIIKTSSYPIILIEVALLELIDKKNQEISELLNNIEKDKIQEIENISSKIVEKDEEKSVENDDNSNKKIQEIEYKLSEDEEFIKFKNIRINNALATANKERLNQLQKKWASLEELLMDKKIGVIAGMLNDLAIVVAGENNLILAAKTNSLADRLNIIIKESEKTITKVLEKNYKIITLSEEEWLKEKGIYIENIKNKKKYELLEEIEYNQNKKRTKEDIKELINLFGEDIIEYK